MSRLIRIFDTTLRDGEQSPGAAMNPDEKLMVAKQLARLGVDIIEAGFAYSSPGDFDAVRPIAQERAGATSCSVPDSVAYCRAKEFGRLVRGIRAIVPNIKQAVISVHCHNDLGMAVSIALAAVMEDAGQVECTVNEIGERAGDASMEE